MSPSASLVAFRFGYGLPLVPDAPQTPETLLAALAGPDDMAARFTIPSYDWVHERVSDIARNKRAAKSDPVLQSRLDAVDQELEAAGLMAMRATIARAVDAKDSFRERLVAFWADHFTVGAGGREDAITPYAFVEDAIRPHVAGRFADMLSAVVHHPGMLRYLDQTRSTGPNSKRGLRQGGGLNENLARELLELHTLGVGADYAQTDVRQLAELLTGLTYDPRRGYSFDGRMAEPGPETVLGKDYDGKGEAPIRAFLSDLSTKPDTARHIARKLAVHFISDTPDEDLVTRIAQAWATSEGDLMAVYGALLHHPAAFDGPAAKARQPWDFLLAALRGLGVKGKTIMQWQEVRLRRVMILPLRAMGQYWKSPPGPDGWPENTETWITPQGLAERIGWAMRWPTVLADPPPLPRDFADRVLGDRAAPATVWATERAESLAEGLGIVLSSPEFNRR
ncbi:MAG: DUF1800 domain-containing protein [Rhodobacteraceae bacterium]|nr:DUF1800 domain-containing protein [Paracoccaceae bacterium]